jgi:clan AA aspartic protease
MKNLDLRLLNPLTPSLELLVLNGGEKKYSEKIPLQALIDTGFDDYLTIPKRVADKLKLEILGQDEVILANGEQYTVDVCRVQY